MAGGMLHELQRQLDAFMTANADLLIALITTHDVMVVDAKLRSQTCIQPLQTLATSSPMSSQVSSHADADAEPAMMASLGRLQWMSKTFASRCLCEVVQLLLSWSNAVESLSVYSSTSTKRLASWLSAHLLAHVFEELSTKKVKRSQRAKKPDAIAHMVDAMMELVLDKCFHVFQEYSQSQSHLHSEGSRGSEPTTSFFAFKTLQQTPKPLSIDTIMFKREAAKWRYVLAWVSIAHSVTPIRIRIQREIANPSLLSLKTSAQQLKEHPFAQHLALLRLGIASNSVALTTAPQPFTQRLKDAALFLKTLHPLLIKPTKSYIRLSIFPLIAAMLKREVLQMDQKHAHQVYTTVHVSEWNSCMSDLHAVAMKSASKKKKEFVAVGWELRVAVLCISPNDIFSRYWKDDVHALLRLQYQHNKDGTSGNVNGSACSTLESIGFCFSQLLQRHFLIERKVPNELDCMEIINTMQAWCFFSSFQKQKSLQRFKNQVMPVLVSITLGIASYNMTYAVQSHLRRLLTEAESIFDEKKLVGLESLVAICRHCSSENQADNGGQSIFTAATLQLDKKTMLANTHTLGEHVGHILIECNTNLGHELLIDMIGISSSSLTGSASGGSSAHPAAGGGTSLAQPSSTSTLAARFMRDDFKRALAVQTFGAALCSLEFLYLSLELSEDQKMMLIARASIHSEDYVRKCASKALHCIVVSREKYQAAIVFRGLTDFVLRMTGNQANASDIEASIALTRLLGSLLRAATEAAESGHSCWENGKARDESLLQVEAVCVYLLVNDNTKLRECILTTLEIIRAAALSAENCGSSNPATQSAPAEASYPRRLSVLDIVEAMEPEVELRFFSFLPQEELQRIRSNAVGSNSLWKKAPSTSAIYFIYLARDSSFSRHSFRWAVCLSMLFARLAHCIPEVTVYIWSDVNDKILKLEPIIPVSFGESETYSDIVRWRNLSILATATSRTSLAAADSSQRDGTYRSQNESQSSCSGSVQSVISTSAITSLFKRLGRYLKSPSTEQRKAAILALGSTNSSAFSILIDVLGKYEAEAFITPSGSREPTSGSGTATSSLSATSSLASNWKQSRQSKIKLGTKSSGQTQLQWALGRCYRLLLENLLIDHQQRRSSHLHQVFEPSESLIQQFQCAARGFLDKMSVVLEKAGAKVSFESENVHFMMQQDFCSSLRAFLLYPDREQTTADNQDQHQLPSSHSQSTTSSASEATDLLDNVREKLFYLVMSWCSSIGVLATARLGANLDSRGFFAFSSPLLKVWMQCSDVFGDRYGDDDGTVAGNGDFVVLSHWVDEVDLSFAMVANNVPPSISSTNKSTNQFASYQRYFLCQTAFAAMTALLKHGSSGSCFSPPILPDSPVFQWLDECFCIDSSLAASSSSLTTAASSSGLLHFQPLQKICFEAIQVLLTKDFKTFGPICIEKALFTQQQGDKFTMSKRYFCAISDKVSEFKKLWTLCGGCEAEDNDKAKDERYGHAQLLAHFFRVAILHVGVGDDEAHRALALSRLKKLLQALSSSVNSSESHGNIADIVEDVSGLLRQQHGFCSSESKCLPVLRSQVTNRVQVAVSSHLATHLPVLSFFVSESLLRFISYCEVTQQRKLFAIALPWLAEINLTVVSSHRASEDSNAQQQLLNLLFRLTKSLSSSCGDQLEHAWLTLAFTPRSNDQQQQQQQNRDEDLSPTSGTANNMAAIIRFLFFQRASHAHLATSKTIFWWLSRWQSAAFEVIGTLVDLVITQRRRNTLLLPSTLSVPSQATDTRRGSFPEDASAHSSPPLNDVAVLLTLLSDSSCNLLTPGFQDTMMVSEMALQIIHFAFLMLYCNIGDTSQELHGSSSAVEISDSDLYEGITQDCLLVLRNALPLLQAPLESIEPLLNDLTYLEQTTDQQCFRKSFESVLAAYVRTYLPSYEVLVWSEECVKEFALAISVFSTRSSDCMTSQAPMEKAKLQSSLCLRFALSMHRLLAAPFHGDVFLILMELLHHSLDEQNRDPTNANALVRDCLVTLRAAVELMPFSKLVLYPQILWVCMALLNYCKTSVAYYGAIVDLLFELLNKPQFFTNQVLQGVLMCKRPQQWSNAQSSVLRAMALNMYLCTGDGDADLNQDGGAKAQDRGVQLLTLAVMLDCPVLMVDVREHAVICTIALMPVLGAEGADHEEWARLKQIAMDLNAVWQEIEGEEASSLCQLFEQCAASEFAQTNDTKAEFLVSFATEFIPFVRGMLKDEPSFDGLSVCFEILLRAAEYSGQLQATRETRSVISSERKRQRTAHIALLLVEELLKAMEKHSFVWRMPSPLVASLVRLVREPQNDLQWEIAVRTMTFVDTPATTPEVVISSSPQFLIPAIDMSSLSGGDNSNRSTPMTPKSPKAEASAPPSIKKDSLQTARKFMNLMARKSSSPSSSKHNNSSNNNATSTNTSNNDNNSTNSSCGSSTSIIGGSNTGAEGPSDPAIRTDSSLQKADARADQSDGIRPPPTPTKSRLLFRS